MWKECAVVVVVILAVGIAMTFAGGGRVSQYDHLSEGNRELVKEMAFYSDAALYTFIGIIAFLVLLCILYKCRRNIVRLWYRCKGREPRELRVKTPSHVRTPSPDPLINQDFNTDDESVPRVGGAARYVRPLVEGDGMLAEVSDVSSISPSVLHRTNSRRNVLETTEGAYNTPRERRPIYAGRRKSSSTSTDVAAAMHQIAADVHRPRHVAQLSDDESSPERGPEDEPKRPIRDYRSPTDVRTIQPLTRSRAASLRGSQSPNAVAKLSDNKS